MSNGYEKSSKSLGRFQNMRELLVDDHFQAAVENSSIEPLIVCGDFNSPSHLDWTNETRLAFFKMIKFILQ